MPYVEIKKSRAYEWIKRILDISLSAFLLLLFLPIVLCVAIAIKIDSKGPILADTPERVGKNGSLFKMYKFRSMVENAHEILRENPKFATLYSEYKRGSYKLKDDPRITWMGHFIRKHSLDEVPQLLNILKGERTARTAKEIS
ncbi:MAG: Glycosyl transferase [Candidatus Levybacteria bacterium GW2011_GWC2_40_7]|nr:MAG: Glycosyl transferase [Candidatus Levybacteria bacterium GW2011_GWC2_40_7]